MANLKRMQSIGPPAMTPLSRLWTHPVYNLKVGKPHRVCILYAEMLKAEKVITRLWLQCLISLQSLWNTILNPSGWKRGFHVPTRNERVTIRSVTTAEGYPRFSTKKVLHKNSRRQRPRKVADVRHQQSAFTLNVLVNEIVAHE